MTIFSFAMFAIALVSLGLAVFIFSQSRKPLLNKIFILLLLSLAGWSGFLFVIYDYTNTEEQALFLSRLVHMFGVFIPVLFLHFTYIFLEKNKERKLVIMVAYLWAFLMLGVITTKFFIRGMTLNFNIFSPVPGPFYFVHMAAFAGFVIYFIFRYSVSYKAAVGLKKNQIRYVMLAVIFGFGGGSTSYLRPFLNMPPVHGFFIPLYAIMITYAILKYRLMEISFLIRKGIIYSFLTIFVMGFFVLSIFLGQEIFQSWAGINPLLVALSAAVIIALVFNPLERAIARATDKIFFKAQYDYQQTLITASQVITSMIKLEELLPFLFRLLTKTVKARNPKLFILDKRSGALIERALNKDANKGGNGEKGEKRETAASLTLTSCLPVFLREQKTAVVSEELNQMLLSGAFKGEEFQRIEGVKREMEALEAAIVFPLFAGSQLFAVLTLGPKLSGDPFLTTDLFLLNILTSQIAVALQNIKLVEELQERVGQLEKFYELTMGRELKMIELKKALREAEEKEKGLGA